MHKHIKTILNAAARTLLAVAVAVSMTVGGVAIAPVAVAGSCDYSWQTDSAGRRCGGRAANVRPGGRLGGSGHYNDSLGRPRIYGRGNDIYDRPINPFGGLRSQRPSRDPFRGLRSLNSQSPYGTPSPYGNPYWE